MRKHWNLSECQPCPILWLQIRAFRAYGFRIHDCQLCLTQFLFRKALRCCCTSYHCLCWLLFTHIIILCVEMSIFACNCAGITTLKYWQVFSLCTSVDILSSDSWIFKEDLIPVNLSLWCQSCHRECCTLSRHTLSWKIYFPSLEIFFVCFPFLSELCFWLPNICMSELEGP